MKIRILLLLFVSQVLGYQTIIDVLSQEERFSTLLKHLETLKLVPLVNGLVSGTLFAPDNEAFEKYEVEMDNSTMLYHFIKKGIRTDDFYNGQLKETLLQGGPDDGGQRIKVTKTSNIYINQAKIITSDIQVNNETYIQVVDRVLEPPSLLGATIKKRNKVMYDLMASTEIIDLLEKKKPFTVFLSTTNTPLENYNSIESNYLQSKYGQEDLTVFFKYAIIDKIIYMDEFKSGKTTFKSLSGDSLVIASNKERMTVNDIPIVQSDIIASNGVIHEIEHTFKQDAIHFDTRKYMYGYNATQMVQWFDQYDLGHYLDQQELNYTFLVPPHNAMNESMISKSWLSYHIINGSWPQENLKDDTLLITQFNSRDLGGKRQRLPVSVESDHLFSSSIQFDHARMIGEDVNIHDDIIYQITDPLSLPGDILEKLVLDLDLSTFIATLYVSEVVEEIKKTCGLTLFVPTNEAFQKLGLVAQYLVHPTAKLQLQTVLRYHAVANSLLYHDDMKNNVHELVTLANSTLRISQNESGSILVGRPEGNEGVLTHADTLVSNGVVHKISQVQIPNQVKITNSNLLVGIESNTMIQILEKANLKDLIDHDNMVVLAPSDKAFSRIDLDALFENQDQLERLAKLHIIPREWQDRWIEQSSDLRDKSEYPTLLSDDDKVTIRENEKGELSIEVKNGRDSDRAHVTGLGRVSAGGGVIAIDTVLVPIKRGFFGLPWIWSLVVTLIIIIITCSISSIIGFFGYKIYNRRRLGYRPIF